MILGRSLPQKNDELIETSSLAVSTWDTTVRPSDVLADTTNYTDPSSVHNLGHSQAFFPASLPASTLKPATLFEHPRSADVASLSSTDSPSHSQPNSLDSSVLDGPRIRTRKAPTPRYIPRYIPRPRSVLQNFRSPVTAQPSVRVLVWTKLPTDSKARPGVWHFKPAYSDQGTCIVPSSNGHLLDVLASLGSRDGRQIAWFDYGTGAWNYQDVDTPIHIEHDRPILLCNYRVAHQLSVNWAIVGELTGYKYRSFEPPQPYRVSVSPCKRGEHSMRDKPAGQVLQALEEFELDLATNKRGEPVINRFRSRFHDFKGSISAMNRIRRAARALSEEERKVYTSPNAGRMFGEIMDNHKGGH